ncbi:MAG: hypothetical protein H7838_06825 [Magnetococcus sp. DMHC-8]
MKTRIFVGSLLVLLLSFAGTADAGAPQTRKPFDEQEFNRFMTDYPTITRWLTDKRRHAGAIHSPWMLSGMRYDRDFINHLQEKGWDAERFFYLLDHVNMGLMTSRAEADNEAARTQMQQQRDKMQADRLAEQQKWQTQVQEQNRSSLETARAQWSAQRDRVNNDPRIPPAQKAQILAQMDRSQPAPATVGTPEEQQAQMAKQRQAWLAEQKRQVVNNPAIPLPQKQEIIAQMDRSMGIGNGPRTEAAVRPPADPNPTARQAALHAQQQQWIETRMQEVRNNTMIHPAQKQQMLDQLQQSLQHSQTAARHAQESTGLLPAQENELIKNNRQKLTELFFPDK